MERKTYSLLHVLHFFFFIVRAYLVCGFTKLIIVINKKKILDSFSLNYRSQLAPPLRLFDVVKTVGHPEGSYSLRTNFTVFFTTIKLPTWMLWERKLFF